ncbi:MAG: PAS domain S-box protein [Phycisphaerales bacterium]|nr:PAS domain S-box protein [Phycisphaerales bacterium]
MQTTHSTGLPHARAGAWTAIAGVPIFHWIWLIAAFVVACILGNALLLDPMHLPPTWFAAGIAIGAMLHQKNFAQRAFSALIFSLALGVWFQIAFQAWTDSLIAFLSSAIGFFAAAGYLSRLCLEAQALMSFRSIAAGLIPAAMIESVLSASTSLLYVVKFHALPPGHPHMLGYWIEGVLSDLTGSLLVVPIVAALLRYSPSAQSAGVAVRHALATAAFGGAAALLMRTPTSDAGIALGLLCLPQAIALAAGYILGTPSSAFVMLCFVTSATLFAAQATGPLALFLRSGGQGIIGFQILTVSGSLACLFLAAAMSERKRLLESTRQNERKYRGIFERSHEAIIAFDAESETIFDANDRALELYGYARSEFIGAPFSIVNHGDSCDLRRDSAVRKGWHAESAIQQRHKSGRILHVDISASVMKLEGRTVIVSMNRDASERVVAHRALRESEQRFRSFANNVPGLAFCYFVSRDGARHVEYVNPRLAEWRQTFPHLKLGRPLETYLLPFIHPEDRERVVSVVLHARATGTPVDCEYRLQDASGQYRWIHALNAPMVCDGGTLYNCVFLDVTEHRRAIEARQESEARFRSFIEYSEEGVWYVELDAPISLDLPKDEQIRIFLDHGVVRECNNAMARAYGKASAEDVRGKKLRDIVPFGPDGQPTCLTRVVHSGFRLTDAESVVFDEQGNEHCYLAAVQGISKNGFIMGLWATQRDITALKHAQAQALASDKRLRSILDNTPNVAVEEFDIDARVTYWNPAAERMFGWTAAEAVGKTLGELILSCEECAEYTEYLRQLVATGESPAPQECKFRRRDGRIGIAYSSLFRMDDFRTGEPRFVCIDIDITDRLETERTQKQLAERIQQSQKLESIGILAGGIAHDFNNLLMAIMGNAAIASKSLAVDATARGNLALIQQAALDGAALTRQMLVYAGRGERVIEPINLPTLLHETVKLMEVSVTPRAVVRERYDLTTPRLEADATQIRQVIVNLLSNAADAISNPPGLITVTTERVTLDERALHDCICGPETRPGAFAAIRIADNGCGMSRETVDRVFEPFFSTKFSGRGLGMPSTLGIVRSHGGALHIESEIGVGTTVSFYLPVRARSAPRRVGGFTPDAPTQAPQASGRHTILVVEDEAVVRSVICDMLSDAGYGVEAAGDAREALQIVRERGETLDLALVDYFMPDMRGDALLSKLRERCPELRAIIMSGNIMQRGVGDDWCERCEVLSKPFQPADLLAMVDRCLSVHQS